MSMHTRVLGLLALPVFLLAGCDPAGQESQPAGDADAAEAPPTQRPAQGLEETEGVDFSEWDANGDRALDQNEFNAWAEEEGVFDDWFGDDGIDLQAVEEEIRSAIDLNDDGEIDQEDWNAAMNEIRQVFGGESPGEWSEWDTDGDGQLTSEEFRHVAEQRGLQEQMDVDGDGQVSQEDVHSFYFGLVDENGDGRIEADEWNQNHDTWFDMSEM